MYNFNQFSNTGTPTSTSPPRQQEKEPTKAGATKKDDAVKRPLFAGLSILFMQA